MQNIFAKIFTSNTDFIGALKMFYDCSCCWLFIKKSSRKKKRLSTFGNTLVCIKSRHIQRHAYMYICSFKREWVLYVNVHEVLRYINSNDPANPKIQSSYVTPHHFRNMLPHERRTFLREGYIRFRTFTNENIAIPISASRQQVLVRSHSRRRKVSLMVTPSPKRLNGNLREGKIEKAQRRRGTK